MAEIVDNPMSSANAGEVAAVVELVEVPYPKFYLVARALSASPLRVRLWLSVNIWFGVTFPLVRMLGGHGEEEDNEALEWIFDLSFCVAHSMLGSACVSLARAFAPKGGLELLGLTSSDTITVSRDRHRSLNRWRNGLAFFVFFFGMVGGLNLRSVLVGVGTVSKVSGRVLTPLYVYTNVLAGIPAIGVFMSVILMGWIYALQVAAALASETIERVIELVEQHQPADPGWTEDVIPAIKGLTHGTMPVLSQTFGFAMGLVTLAFWSVGLAFFSIFLENRLVLQLVCMLVAVFIPFGLATTVSDASDRCDNLRDSINMKRFEELGSISAEAALQLSEVEKALQGLNRGQGLGFVV